MSCRDQDEQLGGVIDSVTAEITAAGESVRLAGEQRRRNDAALQRLTHEVCAAIRKGQAVLGGLGLLSTLVMRLCSASRTRCVLLRCQGGLRAGVCC